MSHGHDNNATAYGTATLCPTDDVIAGSYNTWSITYTVGSLGMDDVSAIKLAANMTSDWGQPQFSDPMADNYATVETSGDATVEAEYEKGGYVRPYKHTITISVFEGTLAEGETITLTLGDTSQGSMGHQAQTFPETDFEIIVLVDAFGTGEFVRLPETLTFDIVPGRTTELQAFLPTDADINEECDLMLRAEDYWGNTASRYEGTLYLSTEDTGIETPETITVTEGVARTPITTIEPGVHRLTVIDDEHDLQTTTNPLRCGKEWERRTYWGDIHGQSGETVGTGTIQEYFEYARDNAHLDFASHAGNDFQITDDFWKKIQHTVHEFNDPNAFITFLCYEWSANTPAGGDHNIYFRDDEAEIHRSSNWQIEDGLEKHVGTRPVSELYDQYKGRNDVFIIPHQGGRPATLDIFDSDLTPFVEIASVWGIFEWFGQKALERGYNVGFVGGSDDHTGRPGASHPTNKADWNFPIKGPIMAAKAKDLTRDALWNAFAERRCYTTTGARIALDVTVDGVSMGQSVEVDSTPKIDVEVHGTAPVRRIDLFRGSDRFTTRSFAEGDDMIEIVWSGARSKTRHKIQNWSGGLSLSNGKITSTEEFGFDHPYRGIQRVTDTDIKWDGATAGNYQGIRFTVDAPDNAELRVSTAPVNTSFTLAELDEEHQVDAGHLERQIVFRRTGVATVRDVDTTFHDDTVTDSQYPYYIRIRQEDGEMAWSSPIFVTIK